MSMRYIGLFLLASPGCPLAIGKSGPCVILNNHGKQCCSLPMTARIATLVLLAALAAVAQTAEPTAAPQPKPVQPSPVMMKLLGDYGGWWKALSDDARDNFVDGYASAMQKVQFMTHDQCIKNAKSVQPGPEFNAKLQESLNLCTLSQAFDYKAGRLLRIPLDGFYNNPLNAGIPPEFAMEYLRDEIKGNKTAGELRDELNGWRKTMSSPLPSR